MCSISSGWLRKDQIFIAIGPLLKKNIPPWKVDNAWNELGVSA